MFLCRNSATAVTSSLFFGSFNQSKRVLRVHPTMTSFTPSIIFFRIFTAGAKTAVLVFFINFLNPSSLSSDFCLFSSSRSSSNLDFAFLSFLKDSFKIENILSKLPKIELKILSSDSLSFFSFFSSDDEISGVFPAGRSLEGSTTLLGPDGSF